jgi:hypothetical protein
MPPRRDNVSLTLGVASDLSFVLSQSAIELAGITVTGQSDAVLSSDRTGAATSVDRESIEALPSISRRLADYARLTPQISGNLSVAGTDNRLNNITVDGSYFNNSFGLGNSGQPGDRTGVAPISMDAIEQIQVNIAPYDVRQGNFVGAGINTVTRSGTNQLQGSIYHQFRDNGLVGDKAGESDFDVGTFDYKQYGGWLSGPIIQDRAFFFVSYEDEGLTEPGTTFRANTGGQTPGGSITRVLESDLNSLSSFLSTNFGYETGPFQGYDHEVPATRLLAKFDINLGDRNKLSFRYNQLDSETDVLASNSSRWASETAAPALTGAELQGLELHHPGEHPVGGGGVEHHHRQRHGQQPHRRAIPPTTRAGAPAGRSSPWWTSWRAARSTPPSGRSPSRRTTSCATTASRSRTTSRSSGANHTLTFGASVERYESENVFFPGSQSVYVYNSLADFYTDANDHLANPNRTTSPVTLRRFQVRWSNIPGQDKPIQPLEVLYSGIYAQDEWQVNRDLRVTAGVRLDRPVFGDTGFENAQVDGLTFRDETGATVQYSTSKLPDANLLFSPRLGVNWDVFGDRMTQLRGGTGIFTGRPAYVWISNQIGENGVLTGFEQMDNTTTGPFHPDPDALQALLGHGSTRLRRTDWPSQTPTSSSRRSGGRTSPWTSSFPWARGNGRVPLQQGRERRLLHQRQSRQPEHPVLRGGRPAPVDRGEPDQQQRLQRCGAEEPERGPAWNLAASLERPFDRWLLRAKAAYSYGEAKNTVDPGSIAFGSWNNNPHTGDPNNPGLAYAVDSPGHRFFAVASLRRDLLPIGPTTLSIFTEGRTPGRGSYRFAGDINGDGGTSNDLIYIHRDISEMNFQTYSAGGNTFTAEQQAQAWNAYIEQDPYLSRNRGSYAERNAATLPMRWLTDVTIEQAFAQEFGGRRHQVSMRATIQNVMNLLNSDWGVGQTWVNTQPLIVPTAAQGGPADGQGRPQYRLRNIGGQLMDSSFRDTAGIGDVWRIQIGLRYTFN